MKLEIKPLRGRVFIIPEPYKPADTFLALPGTSINRDMPCFGRVLSVGGKRITKKGVVIEREFKPGDHVFFPKFTGLWVNVRGHKLIQVEQKDVWAVITDDGQ